jgi:hypothetical protein
LQLFKENKKERKLFRNFPRCQTILQMPLQLRSAPEKRLAGTATVDMWRLGVVSIGPNTVLQKLMF